MQQHSEEVKATVIAEWKAGSSLNALVKAHGVPKTTVRGWVAPYERVAIAPSAAPKKELATYDLDEMALRLVRGSVDAVDRIYGVTGDGEWLRKQNAADLAVLAGVIADKLYRLLGAIQPTNSADDDSVGVHGAAVAG